MPLTKAGRAPRTRRRPRSATSGRGVLGEPRGGSDPAGRADGSRPGRDGGGNGCRCWPKGQRDVSRLAQSQCREPVLRKQVGQVGYGQQQGSGIGQPDCGHGEGQRVQPKLTGDRDDDRGQQHRRGVEAENDRRYAREPDDEQPQVPGATMTDAGSPVAGNVETPAASAISATTVIATRKIRTGPTRVARSSRVVPDVPVTEFSCRGSTAGPGGQAWSASSRNAGPPPAREP
jgi:hypothetical protein